MYHLKNGVAQIRPDNRTLVAATSLTSRTPEQQPASGFTGLEYYNSVWLYSGFGVVGHRAEEPIVIATC